MSQTIFITGATSGFGKAIAETFAHAGVKCRITDNIEGELWKKFLLNCAGNAVTALGRAPYSVAAYNEFAWKVVAEALTETSPPAWAFPRWTASEEWAKALTRSTNILSSRNCRAARYCSRA